MFPQNFFKTRTRMIKAIITAHNIYWSTKGVRSLVLFFMNVLKIYIERVLLLFLIYLSRREIDAHRIVGYSKWILLYVIGIALFKWLVLLWTKSKSEIYTLSSFLSYLACERVVKDVRRLEGWVQGAKIFLLGNWLLLFLLLRGGPLLIAYIRHNWFVLSYYLLILTNSN